jgi:spore coat protein I
LEGIVLSDKMSEVFREYDMEVLQNMRGRGAIILKTNQGIRQLCPLTESESRLKAEYHFKEELYRQGFLMVDRLIPNRENELVSYDRYQNPFVLRSYFEGREPGMTGTEDIRLAVQNLAEFHLVARKVYAEHSGQVILRNACDFERRNRELKRIRNYMLKNQLRSFELTYLEHFDYFYESGKRCEQDYSHKLQGGMEQWIGYCHGAYDYHSILKGEEGIATVNFGRFYAGNQLADLYHYARKALEKNKYNFQVLKLVLQEYDRVIPLDETALEYIYILLRFPEKFYKISNQYMNGSKNWIPPKLTEKLERVILDESRKTETIFRFREYYSLHI